ncbi:MAG: peptidyl-prolyl cis-trans isomerase [Phycisphaeraceae bacterium]
MKHRFAHFSTPLTAPLSGRARRASSHRSLGVLVLLGLALLGCAASESTDTADDNATTEQVVEQIEAAAAAPDGVDEASDDETDDESGALAPEDLGAVEQTFEVNGVSGRTVAAMVGQVNGRAIYAHDVLDPLHETLAALGRRVARGEVSRPQFRERASDLIAGHVNEIVNDALLLGEAERDLSEQERQYVRHFMRQRRDELVRKHGRGSAAVADRTLRERDGKGLEQTLEQIRQQELVRRYMRLKLQPRINVTRRDIERYYRDHHETYNPPMTRTLRLIRAVDEAAAATIEQRLAEGASFESVAKDAELNAFQPGNGGLMADAPGDDVFGFEPLNEALRELDAGEHAGPIDAGGSQWFLQVEAIDGGEGRSLKDAQREIERRLRLQQFRRLSAQYEQQLYERGSYDSRQEMTEQLLEIAMNLYVGEAE